MNVRDLSLMLAEIHYEADRRGQDEPDYHRTWDELADFQRRLQAARWQWVAERLLPKLAEPRPSEGVATAAVQAFEAVWRG